MLFSYFLTAYRALRNRPAVTAINVAGLAVGLAACVLIALWVKQQVSYDTFHPQSDHLYRLALDASGPRGDMTAPLSPAPAAPVLMRDVPGVKSATRIDEVDQPTIQVGNQTFVEDRVLAADSLFFDVLSGFQLLRGTPSRALAMPASAVLTESAARRYFGTTDALGQTMRVNDEQRTVTGILADPPVASHMQFDVLTTLQLSPEIETSWLANSTYTYVRLRGDARPEAFRDQVAQISDQYVGPQAMELLGMTRQEFEEQSGITYFAQKVTQIHLHSNMQYELGPTGSIAYVWTFSAVAFLILLLACINFTNLATARATERAAEVGMRKALGAHRGQLAGQFLGEAMLTTLVAAGLAFVLVQGGLPFFNAIAETNVQLGTLTAPTVLAALGGIAVVGGLAGLYPALVLSGFTPARVLKGTQRSTTGKGGWLRQGLVVFQFTITIAMMAGTAIIWSQFDYIQSKRLGIETERVIAVERAAQLGERQETLKAELRSLPSVASVGASNALFDAGNRGVNNFNWVPNDLPSQEGTTAATISVDANVADVLGIALNEGRLFDPARATDTSAVVINETAAQMYGFDRPTENTLRTVGPQGETFDVIGVVEDFHFQSLRQPIRPVILTLDAAPRKVLVRAKPGQAEAALAGIQQTWATFAPNLPLTYGFADAQYAQLHQDTQRTGRLFLVFAGLAIAVACFGLFGLAMYTAQRRTKEIGIRKALGATTSQIILLLSNRFAQLVGVAFVLAAPIAYLGMSHWLSDFAYRVDPSAGAFLGAGVVAMVVALGTVSIHAFRAARLDPATTLRDE